MVETLEPAGAGLPTPPTLAELDAFFNEEQEPDNLPPLTDEEAERIIARYNRHAAEVERIQANADALIREERRKMEGLLFIHGERLRLWTAGKLRGKSRSVRTLQGVAGFRTQPARLSVTDERAALEWAKAERPEAVETVERLTKGALGKPADWQRPNPESGEMEYAPPPGVTITPEEDRFYVKAGTPAKGAAGEEDAA